MLFHRILLSLFLIPNFFLITHHAYAESGTLYGYVSATDYIENNDTAMENIEPETELAPLQEGRPQNAFDIKEDILID